MSADGKRVLLCFGGAFECVETSLLIQEMSSLLDLTIA